MRGNRRKLLTLIEQKPRSVSELAALTNITMATVYDAVREFRALGIVCAKQLASAGRGRSRKVYALPSVDLSSFA